MDCPLILLVMTDLISETCGFIKGRKYLIPSTDGKDRNFDF